MTDWPAGRREDRPTDARGSFHSYKGCTLTNCADCAGILEACDRYARKNGSLDYFHRVRRDTIKDRK